MNIVETNLPAVLIIEPSVFGDERGFFMETWNRKRYEEAGLPDRFVQDNLSYSAHGVLRGLHFQNPQPQGKLVSVLRGGLRRRGRHQGRLPNVRRVDGRDALCGEQAPVLRAP